MQFESFTFRSGRALAAFALFAATLGPASLGCVSPEPSGTDRASGDSIEIAPARPAKWAEAIALPGLPNLYRVTPVLYRGAQPTAQGWSSLEQLGVRSVLSLRVFHADSLPRDRKLRLHSISFKSWHPEEEDVVQFLRIAHDPANQPLLVHCQYGSDRTGMLIAIERMTIEGWSREDAIREMVEGGYGFHSIWQNLIEYVEQVDVDRLRRLAGIEPASVSR